MFAQSFSSFKFLSFKIILEKKTNVCIKIGIEQRITFVSCSVQYHQDDLKHLARRRVFWLVGLLFYLSYYLVIRNIISLALLYIIMRETISCLKNHKKINKYEPGWFASWSTEYFDFFVGRVRIDFLA